MMVLAPLSLTGLANGLIVAAAIVALVVGLPTLIGMAISVARPAGQGRWSPLAMGAIIGATITLVTIELIDLSFALVVGGVGLAGGALIGALIGGIVRVVRGRRAG